MYEWTFWFAKIFFRKLSFSKKEVFFVMIRLLVLSRLFSSKVNIRFRCFGFIINALNHESLSFSIKEMFLGEQYYFYSDQKNIFIADCGSNIGISILYFKYLYPDAKLICFEPQKLAFEFLVKNIEANKLKDVTAYNIALSNQKGEVDFFEHNSGVGLMASIYATRETHGVPIKIPTQCLSSFLNHRQIPTFIKIDVDGAEDLIIQDLLANDQLRSAQIVIEYHHGIHRNGVSLVDLLKIMGTNNYTYNLRTSFRALGDYRDIGIHFVK